MATDLAVLSFSSTVEAAGAVSGATPGVVGLTLAAAVLHAVWNAVAHAVPDRLVGFALIGMTYTVVCGVAVFFQGLPPTAGVAVHPGLDAESM